MRKDFLSQYRQLVKAPVGVLRHMFKELVHDSSAASTLCELAVDDRVAKAILELEDPEVIIDLRRNNGKVMSSFQEFWTELQNYLDEIITPVNERRHGDFLYLPIAISVRDLREIISERLAKQFPDNTLLIPSEEDIIKIWVSCFRIDEDLLYSSWQG